MHPSQRQMHHHLARALMHLNHLASFLRFFQPHIKWETNVPPMPMSTHPSRTLHTFVPLPTASSPATRTYLGGLPPHMVVNPEPHFRAITVPTPDQEMPPPSSVGYRLDGTWRIHSGNTFHLRPLASSPHPLYPAICRPHPCPTPTNLLRCFDPWSTCTKPSAGPSAPLQADPKAKVLPIPADEGDDTHSDQPTIPHPKANPASANPIGRIQGPSHLRLAQMHLIVPRHLVTTKNSWATSWIQKRVLPGRPLASA